MTDLSGVNNALQNGYTIKLESKGKGILHELKSVFTELQKNGKIKDANGDGLTNKELANMYKVLNEIHEKNNMSTNYTRMAFGAEFNYTSEQLLELAQASGFEVVEEEPKENAPVEDTPDLNVKPEDDAVLIEKKAVVTTLPEDMDINHPPVQYESERVPDGAKMEKRDIVNIGDQGSREVVVTTRNEDGVKVYHQVETDPETGEAKMGKRLAVDTRGLKKNEYYAIDETIPDGVEVDTNKTVDGKKNQMTYTFKAEDGKTHRYAMIKNEDGTYAKGEELVSICGSGKFMSQSALNKLVLQVLPNGLPEGVEVQVVDRNGLPTPIFKKDGKTLALTQTPEPVKSETKSDKKKTPKITDEFRTKIKSMRTGVFGLQYQIDDNGNLKQQAGVSLIDSDFLEIDHNVQSKDGKYTKWKCSSSNYNIMHRMYTSAKQRLCINQAIYNELSQKSNLSAAEQKFMQQHEQQMHEFLSTAK
ncbi:MAG: hypothetical protein NC390_02385 [Fusobacterium sp.]|nr:hypothetical protein [Fusobacterium sp.]